VWSELWFLHELSTTLLLHWCDTLLTVEAAGVFLALRENLSATSAITNEIISGSTAVGAGQALVFA
jgi:hypothetical protein